MSEENEPINQPEPEKEWPFQYLIPNTPYMLFWDPGKSGLMPDISTFRYWEDDYNNPIEGPPRLTIHYTVGSYLDVCPKSHMYIDATGGEFVYGGGDCKLERIGHPEDATWLSEIMKEKEERRTGRSIKKIKEEPTKNAREVSKPEQQAPEESLPTEKKDRVIWEAPNQDRQEQTWEIPGEDNSMYPPEASDLLYHSQN